MRKKKQKKEYTFQGDFFTSEILCDMCDFGKSGECEAKPPCEIYQAFDCKRED